MNHFDDLKALHNKSMKLLMSTSQVQRGMHGGHLNLSALHAMDDLHCSLALNPHRGENNLNKSNMLQAKNVNMFLSVHNP